MRYVKKKYLPVTVNEENESSSEDTDEDMDGSSLQESELSDLVN